MFKKVNTNFNFGGQLLSVKRLKTNWQVWKVDGSIYTSEKVYT